MDKNAFRVAQEEEAKIAVDMYDNQKDYRKEY